MLTLLIIADDFTGALDAGVQFSKSGAVTRVVTDRDYDYGQAGGDVQVLVMDAETRHLSAAEAYETVYAIAARAVNHRIPHIYKKTDSALRGNIGSELAALLAASGENGLPFFPAFPKMGRVTRAGYHYIGDVKVEDSVFGQDPYEPVRYSYIPELIRRQCSVRVRTIPVGKWAVTEGGEPEICVFDAQDDEYLRQLGESLCARGGLRIMAGCAGFAQVLPKLLKLEGSPPAAERMHERFLVVCGSINPITVQQLDYAEKHGFLRFRMSPVQKLEGGYWDSLTGRETLKQWERCMESSPYCIVDSSDPPGGRETAGYAREKGMSPEAIRKGVAGSLGRVLRELLSDGLVCSMLLTGGDTLIACMRQLGVKEMEPICEMGPGIVLSRFWSRGAPCQVISKSGGFGGETLLTDLAGQICERGCV